MSKQHFEMIARVIREMDTDVIANTDRHYVATMFANELAATNPRFDRNRFIAACIGEDSTDSAGRRVRYSA